MSKFDWKIEENTNTGEKQAVANFQGKLISVAKEALKNVKGTEYYPATVEFETEAGNIVQRGCLIYKTNHDYGMSIGNTYLGRVIKSAGKLPLMVLSHLDRASQASDDDFGFDISLLEVADFDAVTKK